MADNVMELRILMPAHLERQQEACARNVSEAWHGQ